jgi:quinolinate synthase
MKKFSPQKTFINGPDDSGCNCAECPYMRLNTLEKLYLCMKNESPEIRMHDDLLKAAYLPLRKMMEITRA